MADNLKKDLENNDASPSKKFTLRKLPRRIISVCVIAVVALVVGISAYAMFSQSGDDFFSQVAARLFNQDASDDADVSPEADAAADQAEREAAEAAQAEQNAQAMAEYEANRPSANDADAIRPVVHEEDGIEYRRDEVLISFDEGTSHESLNELISHYDFVETTDVSSQDLKNGFVKVVVKEGVDVPEASRLLENDGIIAHPNYVLRILDDWDEGESAQGGTISATPDGTSQNGAAPAPATPDAAAQETATQASQVQPAATLKETEWMLDSTDTRKAWSIQKSSEGKSGRVSVAVIDTGCLVTHEDLRDNVVATYNATSDTTGTAAVADVDGHGTHVAGIVAANSKNDVGMAGTSSDAGLVIINVKDSSGTIDMSYVTKAYTWLLEDHDKNGLTRAQEYNVRVVNISLGNPGEINPNSSTYKKIDEAAAQGILTVVAAGNNKGATPPYDSFPGDYATCFQVINLNHSTSSTPNDSGKVYLVEKDSSSNFNTNRPSNLSGNGTKDISAPGTIIYSTEKSSDSSYGYKTGTSMAAPAVAGIAALMFAYDPNLKPAQVQRLLEHTATDLNASSSSTGSSTARSSTNKWTTEYGYGEINSYRALQVLSASIVNESLDYLTADQVKLSFPDNTEVTLAEWNANASSDEDKWTLSSSNPSVIDVDNTTGKLLAKGTGEVTITATYGGSLGTDGSSHIRVAKQIKVTPLDLNNFTLVSEDPDNPGNLKLSTLLMYTGKDLTPQERDYKTASYQSEAYNGVQTIQLGTDYGVFHANNTNVGEATLTMVPKDTAKFTGNKTVKYSIAPRSLSTAKVEIADQVYSGSALTPKPKVTVTLDSGDSVTLRENVEYQSPTSADYSNNTNKGTATVVIRAIEGSGFTGSVQGSFKIKQDIALCSVTVSSVEYTGRQVTPTVTVKDGSTTLVKDKDYTLEVGNNINASAASGNNAPYVTVNGKGEYAGSLQKKFAITQATLTSDNVASIGVQYYTGSPIYPKPVVTYNGLTLVEKKDYELSYPGDHTSVTTGAQVRVEGKGNFKGTVNKYFIIREKTTTDSGDSNVSGNNQGGTGSDSSQGGLSNQGGQNPQGNSGNSNNNSSGNKGTSNSGGSSTTTSKITMYRLYNPNSGEHLYTSKASERDWLKNDIGWVYEGVAWYAPETGNPVYRLYNPNTGDHHYTADASERDWLKNDIGWVYEGIGWYSGGSKPLYRMFNPNETIGTHHYTTSVSERDWLKTVGWKAEGIGWYGM